MEKYFSVNNAKLHAVDKMYNIALINYAIGKYAGAVKYVNLGFVLEVILYANI